MFFRPDPQQLQALARLAKSPDGEVLLTLLDTELDRMTSNLLDASGDTTLKLQGAAREVKEVIVLIRQAPELAQKTR